MCCLNWADQFLHNDVHIALPVHVHCLSMGSATCTPALHFIKLHVYVCNLCTVHVHTVYINQNILYTSMMLICPVTVYLMDAVDDGGRGSVPVHVSVWAHIFGAMFIVKFQAFDAPCKIVFAH